VRILLLDGNENQAVACVRSLARAGHEVHVGADRAWSKAGWSRAAHAVFAYPSPRADAGAFVRELAGRAAGHSGTMVLPLTESSTLPISERRDVLLAAGARLALPAHAVVLEAFDKDTTRRIAERAGVCTPRSALASSLAEAERAAQSIGFPLVLKPASSEQVGTGGTTRAAGAPRYAASAGALASAFADMHARAARILLQEYVQGAGTGYFALMRHGALRAEFAHERIRDVRPTGSGSAVRRSIAVDPDVRAASLRILEALEWHGVAMVEFRRRPDGTPVFLEVNGRFWNSLPLAVHAGMDFPALLAHLVEHGDVPEHLEYRTGVVCRWLLGDVRHLAAVMAGAPADFPGEFPKRLPTLASVLRPVRGMRHDLFAWDDPLPAIGDWIHFLFRRVPAALRGSEAA
jgi:predicted ATP-grasp superfamily ATP-dependent carboligase